MLSLIKTFQDFISAFSLTPPLPFHFHLVTFHSFPISLLHSFHPSLLYILSFDKDSLQSHPPFRVSHHHGPKELSQYHRAIPGPEKHYRHRTHQLCSSEPQQRDRRRYGQKILFHRVHTSMSRILAGHTVPTNRPRQRCLPGHLPADFDRSNLLRRATTYMELPWWYGARPAWGDHRVYGETLVVAQPLHHELLFDVSWPSPVSTAPRTPRQAVQRGSLKLNSRDRYLICLTIAPAFLTASIYLCLSRLITVYGPQYSRLAPRSYTYIFIGCDIFALVLQGAGGGIAATARTHAGSLSGTHVMVAGLVWQVVSMTLFMALWADFAIRVHKAKRAQGILKTQHDEFAVLRDSKKFRLLQGGKRSPFLAAHCIHMLWPRSKRSATT